jgi:TRAP-type C4-dicarboxylate transport system permease small subunit
LGFASLLSLALAFYSCRLAWQSYDFNDVSTGVDATPLWIPQLTMALGTAVFALAFVDEFILEIQNKRKPVQNAEMARSE